MDAGLRERRKNASPLGTEGTAWDIGWAAVYLASDEARWVSGVVLPVDAGLVNVTPVTYDTLAQQRYERR
jgi:enoyl-[acyl-carrier-protein] reductase (NADH)